MICSDTVDSSSSSDKRTLSLAVQNNFAAKKSAFLDTLKKSLKVVKLADVSAVCYVDFCRGSTFVGKDQGSALRALVPNIESELKVGFILFLSFLI